MGNLQRKKNERGKNSKRLPPFPPQDGVCKEEEVRRDGWSETLGNDHCFEMDSADKGAERRSPVKHRQGCSYQRSVTS